jgi:mycofactocin glycosyltransferase
VTLPEGFAVRIGRHTRVVDGGAVLIGGAPARVARLTAAARQRVADREVIVTDMASAALADYLLENGLADPIVERLPPADLSQLSVVIPAMDRPGLLARLLPSLPEGLAEVIVVDDGSEDPSAVAEVVAAAGARLLVHETNLGPAAARNTGAAGVSTEYVAFVDTDVVLDPQCLPLLLRHFADPRLALAAPRIVGVASSTPTWITRYEDARSSLDLGAEPAPVKPQTRVAWVPTTCVVVRQSMLGDGFDPLLRAGEDVDLVWRLTEAGHRVRFEPAAVAQHEHRAHARQWLARKFFYGTGAMPLAARHPEHIAPVIFAPWSLLVFVAAVAQRRWSLPVIAVTLGVVIVRISRRIGHLRCPWRESARLTGNGLLSALAQGIALFVRHWWPLALAGSVVSRRVRRATVVAAVADTVWEYARLRPRLDPARFAVARRLDDLAYGAGVWWSSLRGRSIRALVPSIVRAQRPPSRPRPKE